MTSVRTTGSLLVAALVALSSCVGWRSDGEERLEELYPTPAAPPPPTEPVDPCPLPDDDSLPALALPDIPDGAAVTGQWAVRLVQFGSMSPAGLGPWRIRLSDHFLAVPSADGKSMDLTFCFQDVPLTDSDGKPISMGKTSMSENTRKAIAAVTVTVPAQIPAALPLPSLPVPPLPPSDAGTFQVGPVAWLWGVKSIAHPVTDALPTADDYAKDKNDPRIWDQDSDSHPGVTMAVESPPGDRYMARRSVWSFGQPKVGSYWVTGPLTFAVTENALDATNPLLKTVAPISVRSECTSVYQLRWVDSTYTCSQVSANSKVLWRDLPKP